MWTKQFRCRNEKHEMSKINFWCFSFAVNERIFFFSDVKQIRSNVKRNRVAANGVGKVVKFGRPIRKNLKLGAASGIPRKRQVVENAVNLTPFFFVWMFNL